MKSQQLQNQTNQQNVTSEWINITKQKLKERETKLLMKRNELVELSVNTVFVRFAQKFNLWTDPNGFSVNKELIGHCLHVLYKKIDGWTGIELNRSLRTYDNLAQYVLQSKNWLDGVKKSIYGKNYWIKIFDSISQLIQTSANAHYGKKDIFNESVQIYHRCLFINVLAALFDETIQFPQTKDVPLIGEGIIMKSKEVHNYLHGRNIHLPVPRKSKSAKQISHELRKKLHSLSSNLDDEFEHHTQTKNNKLINILFDQYCNNNQIAPLQFIPNVNVNVIVMNNAGYNPIHGASTNVFTQRYNPMHSCHCSNYYYAQ